MKRFQDLLMEEAEEEEEEEGDSLKNIRPRCHKRLISQLGKATQCSQGVS